MKILLKNYKNENLCLFWKKNKAKKNREIDFSKSISLLSYY